MRSDYTGSTIREVARAGVPALSRTPAGKTRPSRRDVSCLGCVALAVASILAATPLAAQTPMASLYDKYQFDFSGTTIILNANVRIDSEDGPGTEVDAEDDLGLPKTRLQPRGAFRWRPGHSHELEIGYQFARRDGGRRFERTFNFGDQTFEAGLQADTHMDTDQGFLNYRWAFMAKERYQVGLGVGVGIINIDLGVDAVATVDSSQAELSVSKSFRAPMGSLGLYGRYLAGDRWYFEGDVRYIQASFGRLDARVAEAGLATRFFIKRWIGLEVGYGLSAIKLDIGVRESEEGEPEGIFSGLVKYSLQSARFGVILVPWS